MSGLLLPARPAAEVRALAPRPIDAETRAAAERIVEEVRVGGEDALRRHAERLDGLRAGAPLRVERGELEEALDRLPAEQRSLLERTAERLRTFALAQRSALSEVEVPVPGGRAGHSLAPVGCAGCYAPGGRFPLPSSVLMTAVTARAAGVPEV